MNKNNRKNNLFNAKTTPQEPSLRRSNCPTIHTQITQLYTQTTTSQSQQHHHHQQQKQPQNQPTSSENNPATTLSPRRSSRHTKTEQELHAILTPKHSQLAVRTAFNGTTAICNHRGHYCLIIPSYYLLIYVIFSYLISAFIRLFHLLCLLSRSSRPAYANGS